MGNSESSNNDLQNIGSAFVDAGNNMGNALNPNSNGVTDALNTVGNTLNQNLIQIIMVLLMHSTL